MNEPYSCFQLYEDVKANRFGLDERMSVEMEKMLLIVGQSANGWSASSPFFILDTIKRLQLEEMAMAAERKEWARHSRHEDILNCCHMVRRKLVKILHD